MWVLYAFCSAVFAGITTILAKIGIKGTDSNLATAIRTIVILIFSWIMVFIVGSQGLMFHISGKTLLFLILSGLATGASWLCYFKALQLGDVNKVTPIDKSSTVLTMILAFIFLGEKLTWIKFFGMCAIGIGTYMMITKKEKKLKEEITVSRGEVFAALAMMDEELSQEVFELSNNKWLFYAAFSAIFASLTSILAKVGIVGVEANLGTAIRTIVVLIMAWVVVFIFKKQKELKNVDKKNLLFICLSGITTGASWLCYYSALQKGLASVVVPIDKLSIAISVAFSYFFLNEKITKKSFLGLTILISGTLILLIK